MWEEVVCIKRDRYADVGGGRVESGIGMRMLEEDMCIKRDRYADVGGGHVYKAGSVCGCWRGTLGKRGRYEKIRG